MQEIINFSRIFYKITIKYIARQCSLTFNNIYISTCGKTEIMNQFINFK